MTLARRSWVWGRVMAMPLMRRSMAWASGSPMTIGKERRSTVSSVSAAGAPSGAAQLDELNLFQFADQDSREFHPNGHGRASWGTSDGARHDRAGQLCAGAVAGGRAAAAAGHMAGSGRRFVVHLVGLQAPAEPGGQLAGRPMSATMTSPR